MYYGTNFVYYRTNFVNVRVKVEIMKIKASQTISQYYYRRTELKKIDHRNINAGITLLLKPLKTNLSIKTYNKLYGTVG